MQVDPNDPNSVLWLQQSLLRVVLGRVFVEPTGTYDAPTLKAVSSYQEQNGLPVTGQADAATIHKIEQDLVVLDNQPYKRKQPPMRFPSGAPGTPINPKP